MGVRERRPHVLTQEERFWQLPSDLPEELPQPHDDADDKDLVLPHPPIPQAGIVDLRGYWQHVGCWVNMGGQVWGVGGGGKSTSIE